MRLSILLRAACWAAFVFALPGAQAEVYQAEGVASLEAGRVAAREAAIGDALRQIAITHRGGMLASSQVVAGLQTAESMMLGPLSLPGKTRVLSETLRDGLLLVRVEHDTDAADGEQKADACQRATMPPGRFLARRIVTSYFQLERPADASDLGSIAVWFPGELVRLFNLRRETQALYAGTMSIFPGGRMLEATAAADTVREIGRREGAQFVLAGRIIDTAVTRREPRVGVFGSGTPSGQGTYYTGPLAGLLGMSVRNVPVERRFEIEYWLYDTLSGGVLLRDNLRRVARGDVHAQSSRVFNVDAMVESEYGQAMGQVLEEVAAKVSAAVQCLPFATRVARVEGDKVYLSAGALDGLAVRDRLVVYKPRPATEIRRIDGEVLGVPELQLGDVEIEQVQPRFAVARLRNGKLKVDVGDWVRFPVLPK